MSDHRARMNHPAITGERATAAAAEGDGGGGGGQMGSDEIELDGFVLSH
jgi:hypothetical protein